MEILKIISRQSLVVSRRFMLYSSHMTTSIQHILRGIGSIFDLMPYQKETDYSDYPRRMDPEELMATSWFRVGKDIGGAIDNYRHDQETLSGESRFRK